MIEVSGEGKELLAAEGFDPTFGARPLRRAIQRLVENPLAEEILSGRIKGGDTVQVMVKDGALVFNPAKKAVAETP